MPSFDEEITALKSEMFLAEETAQSLKIQASEADKYAKECKRHIISLMQQYGVITATSDWHKITLKKTPSAVVIVDEKLLPPDFMHEQIKLYPNKELIKQAIKDGYEVAGAKLSDSGVTLQFTTINKR